MNRTLLEVRGFAPNGPGHGGPDGPGVSFDLNAGECLELSGPSGSGKTTLVLAAGGHLDAVRMRGEVRAFPNDSGTVGLTLQNPECQILCATVLEEAAFGPENQGVGRDEARERGLAALARIGLQDLAANPVDALSMGQKQRLALAAMLAMEPDLLLLDEPFTQLDAQGRDLLGTIIREEIAAGRGVLLCEHELRPLRGLARKVSMDDTEVVPEWGGGLAEHVRYAEPPESAGGVSCRDVRYAYPQGRTVLDGAGLEVPPGEKVLLWGANGCGKSTLLRCLTGLLRPDAGEVQVAGRTAPRPWHLAMRAGYLGQDPEVLLFEETAVDEIAFPLQRLGFARKEARRDARALLDATGLGALADRSPFTLSFGQKHLLSLLATLAPCPEVLLLDEPFTGLSRPMREAVLGMISEYAEARQAAVVMVSHDERCRDWADRTLLLEEGTVRVG